MSQTSGLRTSGPQRDLNLDLLDIGTVPCKLNYQGNWEVSIMCIPMLVFLCWYPTPSPEIVFYSYANIFVWFCTKNNACQLRRVINNNSSLSTFTFQRSIYLINATCKPVALTLQFIDVYKTLDKGQEWALEFPLSW